MTKKEIREELLKAMDEVVKKYLSELKFNITRYGKVVSFSNGIAKVLIDDIQYNCKCKITVSVGNSVRVIIPNNDYSRIYVDGIE